MKEKQTFTFNDFKFSSQLVRDLVNESSKVTPLITNFFSEEHIIEQIKKKTFTQVQRQLLVERLKVQNQSLDLSILSQTNIEKLKHKNTFTITTGHQLNLLTGPLYSIYKILQIILWADHLNKSYSDYHFVPVFWMATEDHDFEEINHIHLFNKSIEWTKNNQNEFIAGAIETDSNFEETFAKPILELFNDVELKNKVLHYLKFYDKTNLANATRLLINDLFKTNGIVIIDGNDKALKQSFAPIMSKELNENITHKTVSKTNLKLNHLGYHQQVFLRESNLFYIDQHTRHRIVKTNEGYNINGTYKTVDELTELLAHHPERFSPNALLRPVYQETVLPNLVYFGGGGEIAYWLQLKDLFNSLELTFPLLRVRDSYILLSEKQIKQMENLDLTVLDLKQNFDDLAKQFVKKHSKTDLNLEQQLQELQQIKKDLLNKVQKNDDGILRFIESEFAKMSNQIAKIEKKLLQSEKKHQDQTLNQIHKLKTKIYPDNGFQERYENFLQYIYIPEFIEQLKKTSEKYLDKQAHIKLFEL